MHQGERHHQIHISAVACMQCIMSSSHDLIYEAQAKEAPGDVDALLPSAQCCRVSAPAAALSPELL
jgi:hypothetical protein